jgi:hypothetical protein
LKDDQDWMTKIRGRWRIVLFCFVLNSKNEIMLQQRAHQTILRFFGLIPVAVIKGKGRVIRVLVVEDYLKKWVLKRSLKSFSFYL